MQEYHRPLDLVEKENTVKITQLSVQRNAKDHGLGIVASFQANAEIQESNASRVVMDDGTRVKF